MSDLDNILNNVEAPEPEVTPEAEAPEPEAKEAQPETEPQETGDNADAEPQPETPPVPENEPQDTPHVPLKALEDERRKRQELEARLSTLEQGSRPEPEPVPDMFEDPEGFKAYQERQRTELEASTDERLFQERCSMSEMLVKSQHTDYDDAYKAFEAAIKEEAETGFSPLAAKLRQSPNPALFAYEQGKRHMLMSQIDDPETFRKSAYDEGYQAALKELQAKQKATDTIASNLPKSLADESSAGARTGPEWTGPEPMDNLLPS